MRWPAGASRYQGHRSLPTPPGRWLVKLARYPGEDAAMAVEVSSQDADSDDVRSDEDDEDSDTGGKPETENKINKPYFIIHYILIVNN